MVAAEKAPVAEKAQVDIGEYQYGFSDKEDYFFKSKRGLDRETVLEISRMKNEPEWMLEFRLKAYDHFVKRPMPNWGGDLSGIDFDNIFYYIRPSEKQVSVRSSRRTTTSSRR
jgi:Fe-S cluster assembly protein SufB